jgi:hypothetical protein
MAKRDRTQNPKVHDRWNKAGRGKGRGANYQPWLSIQDFAGMTKCARIKGWTTGRTHHLFNRLELDAFYLLDWDNTITDIREQFPIPLEESTRIAAELNIPHPKTGGGFVVFTTTFLINRGKDVVALDIAPTSTSRNQIAEAYWKTQKVPYQFWGLEETKKPAVAIIEWIHGYRTQPLKISEPELFAQMEKSPSIKDAARILDEKYGMGAAIQTFRTLLATKQWGVDMETPINLQNPLSLTHRHAH